MRSKILKQKLEESNTSKVFLPDNVNTPKETMQFLKDIGFVLMDRRLIEKTVLTLDNIQSSLHIEYLTKKDCEQFRNDIVKIMNKLEDVKKRDI